MTIDAALENVVVELDRRWQVIARSRHDTAKASAKDIILKLYVRSWVLSSNVLRRYLGCEVATEAIETRKLQRQVSTDEVPQMISGIRAATETIGFVLIHSGLDGTKSNDFERLLTSFLNAAEQDLIQLYHIQKTFTIGSEPGHP